MARCILAALALAMAGFFVAPSPSTAAPRPAIVLAQIPRLFDAESAAQAHCPRDVVVWLNVPTGIYHYKGERWYGRTKHGAFTCEKEALADGDRASENGQ